MDNTLELSMALLQFFFLAAVVAVLAWLTTRFVGTRMGAASRGRPMRVLQHIPAGRDRSILLLEIGGRLYLIGATANQVSLLDAIGEPETVSRIMSEVPDTDSLALGPMLPGAFNDLLGKALQRLPANLRPGRGPDSALSPAPGEPESGQAEAPDAGESDRLREQIERLRRLQSK